MSYLDKFIGQGGRRSVYDILSLDHNNNNQWENVIKPNYVAEADGIKISEVKIGGNTFTNYGDFQFAWEKSYVKSPERSADGSIVNLNSYATFVTPHLIINFALMSIDDYRKIMRLDLESNEFVVECYDPIYNKKFKGKMYFGTPQMAKLFKLAKIRFDGERWEEFIELVGVQEYTVELIGTNASLDYVSVSYVVNPPANETPTVTNGAEDDVYNGEEVVIGASTDIQTETFNGKYKFKNWNDKADGSGTTYVNGNVYSVNSSLVLYAQWSPTTERTLVFNYGLADPAINNTSYSYELTRSVKKGESIGILPSFDTPKVKAKDINNIEHEYSPYQNGAWYKTPLKTATSQAVANYTAYWSDFSSSLYLLFDTKSYNLKLVIQGGETTTKTVKYNEGMDLPIYVQSGKRFEGWYIDATFTTKFVGNMPPYDITLYARWV